MHTQFIQIDEIETIRALYNAINLGDIKLALTYVDEQIVRIEPEGFPLAGTYQGQSAFEAHISLGRGSWAEGSCTPEKFIVIDDKVIAYLHVKVRLKNASEWIDGHMADVFSFKEGKVIQMRSFEKYEQALRWSGVLC